MISEKEKIRRLANHIKPCTIVDRDRGINEVYRYTVAAGKVVSAPSLSLIAAAMRVHRSTVSRHIRRLVALGFVASQRVGRSVVIQILK